MTTEQDVWAKIFAATIIKAYGISRTAEQAYATSTMLADEGVKRFNIRFANKKEYFSKQQYEGNENKENLQSKNQLTFSILDDDKKFLDTLNITNNGYFGMMTIKNDGRDICHFQKLHTIGEIPNTYPYNGTGFIFIPGVILTQEDFNVITKLAEICNRIDPYCVLKYKSNNSQ